MAANLTENLRELKNYAAARTLDEDTLERRKRLLGEDHPDTLASAADLVEDLNALGEQPAAGEWEQWINKRRK